MMSEDKAKNAMMDAAKLAEELRNEQENTGRLEQDRKMMEARIKDLQIKLDDAETNSIRHGKKAAAKLDARVKELENELDSEQRRLSDGTKTLRKAERRIKELEFQVRNYFKIKKSQENKTNILKLYRPMKTENMPII